MPEYVPHDRIEMKVVRNWARLVKETAQDRGDDLNLVRPFFPFEQTFSDVLAEVKAGTPQGFISQWLNNFLGMISRSRLIFLD